MEEVVEEKHSGTRVEMGRRLVKGDPAAVAIERRRWGVSGLREPSIV